MSANLKETLIARTRKPKARPKEVVFGCLEERMSMMPPTDHLERVKELIDELKRATSNAKDAEE